MTNKTATLLSIFLILAVIIAGILLWTRLPDPMASHWNEQNVVNGYISKFWGVFLIPLMMTGLTLLFFAIPSIDPLKRNIGEFRHLFNIFIVLFNIFMAYVHALTLAWNLGYTRINIGAMLTPALGLFFILIGFGIRKAKRNYFIGIRTPWTLANDKVWEETHKLGGTLFAVSGLIALFGIVLPDQAFYFLIIPILATVLITFLYSYLLFRRIEKE